jgi:hypothetical protein
MTIYTCLIFCLLAADEAASSSPEALERLQALHLSEAQRWQLYLDAEHNAKAALQTKPIYIWTNPTRSGGQQGAVFVWLADGRPAAIGSVFSHPEEKKRVVCHELHALAAAPLHPERGPADQTWTPKGGVQPLLLPEAPPPDLSPSKRLLQMRALTRDFSAHSIDYKKERWELRLLPQPLYRYEKPTGDVVDGALFAFVTSAGTDPEVVLLIEARQTNKGRAWYYRAVRFSDSNLYVQLRGTEIWNSIRDEQHTLHYNADRTYCLLRDKFIPELPELETSK